MSIKVRMFIPEKGDKFKKLSSVTMAFPPRAGENILRYGKDYEVVKVHWDLELIPHEMCIELKEIEK